MIKIFLDTADLKEIEKWSGDSLIAGLTTNPSLARQAGIKDYKEFMKTVLDIFGNDKPISFEVIANNPKDCIRQARIIGEFGKNIYVKIPIRRPNGSFSEEEIGSLKHSVKLNITAITTYNQAELAYLWLDKTYLKHIISIFAGRIADCGKNPEIIFHQMNNVTKNAFDKRAEFLWASTREVYNIIQAEKCADIITCTPAILEKFLKLRNKNLEEYAVETSKMFFQDALDSGLTL